MLLGLVAAGLTFGASGLEPPDLAEVQEFYREVVHLVSVPEPARTNEFRRPRAAPTPAPRESNSVLACEGPEHEKPEHEKPAHEEPEHEEPEVDPAPSLPHSKARRAERSSSKREIVTQEQLEPRPEPFVPEKAAPPVGLVELSTAASSGGDVDAEASSSDSEPSDEGPNPFFAP